MRARRGCVGLGGGLCVLGCVGFAFPSLYLPSSHANVLSQAPAGTTTAGADPALFVLKNLHIIGTMVGGLLDTQRALEFAERGMLKPIYERYSIERLPEAVEKLRRGEIAGRCVVDFNA